MCQTIRLLLDTMLYMIYNLPMNDQQIPHETAAFVLGCARQTVYNLTKSGKLTEPLTAASVQQYIEAQQAELDTIKRRLAMVLEAT